MTQRVNNYQLPSGKLWWLCLYSDGDYVSEILFQNDKAATWYGANQVATQLLRDSGFETLPLYKVTLHGSD